MDNIYFQDLKIFILTFKKKKLKISVNIFYKDFYF